MVMWPPSTQRERERERDGDRGGFDASLMNALYIFCFVIVVMFSLFVVVAAGQMHAVELAPGDRLWFGSGVVVVVVSFLDRQDILNLVKHDE